MVNTEIDAPATDVMRGPHALTSSETHPVPEGNRDCALTGSYDVIITREMTEITTR